MGIPAGDGNKRAAERRIPGNRLSFVSTGDFMKYESALKRRFIVHAGVFRSGVSLLLLNRDWGAASRGAEPDYERAGKKTRCSSSPMSFCAKVCDELALNAADINFGGVQSWKQTPLLGNWNQRLLERPQKVIDRSRNSARSLPEY
jgi:hypothetical protein